MICLRKENSICGLVPGKLYRVDHSYLVPDGREMLSITALDAKPEKHPRYGYITWGHIVWADNFSKHCKF